MRLLAGRPERAEASLREDLDALTALGGGSALATTTALLARALLDQERPLEAEEMCALTERHAAPADTLTQAIWRGVLARVPRGDEALAREAVALVERTDLLSTRGDAMLDLAHVLGLREGDAAGPFRDAIALYERKGNVAAATRARSHEQGGR